jgi:type I restriction enzyme, S subunit
MIAEGVLVPTPRTGCASPSPGPSAAPRRRRRSCWTGTATGGWNGRSGARQNYHEWQQAQAAKQERNELAVGSTWGVFEIARGGSPRPIEKFLTDDPSGLNWVKIGDATASGKYILSTKEKIRKEGLSKTRAVEPGDFLLTNSMSFGRPYIMGTHGCIHDGWLVLKPRKEGSVSQDYMYHVLGSREIKARFALRAPGSTVKNLNSAMVAETSIPLPPLEEQRRIAGILDAADALRRRRRQALALLDTLPGAIFAEMFGDPLVEPGDHDLRPLEEFVDPDRKITYGILKPGSDIPDGVPYIRVVDMKDGTVRLADLKRTTDEIAESYRRSSLKAGDLLMSIRGHVGRTATVPENCDGANITQDTARLALVKAIPEFIEGYLLLPSVQHWMAQRTKGVAVKGINLGDLKKLPVPMLPFEKQDEFRIARRQVLNQRQSMAGHFAELETLFASLQSRAFAGEL